MKLRIFSAHFALPSSINTNKTTTKQVPNSVFGLRNVTTGSEKAILEMCAAILQINISKMFALCFMRTSMSCVA